MKITNRDFIPAILIVIMMAIGILLYPKLPVSVPSHFNVYGDVDSWMRKDYAVFFFPVLIFGLYLLLTFLPFIDPLRKNYSAFEKPYFWFRFGFVIFMSCLYIYTLAYAMGYQIKVNSVIVPLLALGLILTGFFLPKVKKNYFVGIRTPWTIDNEIVWDKTHVLAGKAFIVAGFACLISVAFLSIADSFWFIIFAIFGAAIVPVVYSYFAHKKLRNGI